MRYKQKEQLDNLSLSGNLLHKTLSSLGWINRFFGNYDQLAKAVRDYCKKASINSTLVIVDIGCGGGDVIFHLHKKLNKLGIKNSFIGIDGNRSTIKWASSNYKNKTFRFLQADILDPNFIIPDCDLLISSHFIYHFENEQLVLFLNKIKKSNTKHIIFSELYRSSIAYYLFKMVSPILPISKIAKEDGALAIKRAFTPKEIEEIILKSDITNYQIKKKLWFRMIIKMAL